MNDVKFFGIPVIGLIPNSRSEKAGIKNGDIIVSVNGMATSNFDEYIKACDEEKPFRVVELIRNDREFLTISIPLSGE